MASFQRFLLMLKMSGGQINSTVILESLLDALLKNATGGSGHNFIIGNDSDNNLIGNDENDNLNGGAGLMFDWWIRKRHF